VAEAAAAPAFLDTNVLLYALSADAAKADIAESLLRAGGVINVQVLNEFTSVARRKLGMGWPEIDEVLGLMRRRCTVRDLDVGTHDAALVLARDAGFAWYDALIVAAALRAGCKRLYSQDMQHGMKVGKPLIIVNPFAA
jgi:predicted nucleic acid-binding protein